MEFLLGNKYLAIAKWIAIAVAVWYIFHTWDKAQNYDVVKAQLTAEQKCLEKTVCFDRLQREKSDADKAVAAEQAKAAQANEAARIANEKNAKAEASQQAAEVQANQYKLSLILAKHSPSCDEQRKMVIACALD